MTYENNRPEQIAGALRAIRGLGSTSHLLTFASVALCECRGDEVVNPPSVYLLRLELTDDVKSHSAIRESMTRLVEKGLMKKIDLDPNSRQGRYDWRLSDEGWHILHVTGWITRIRTFAELGPDDESHARRRELIRSAMQDIDDLERTNHVCTLVAVAALEETDAETINAPLVAEMREKCLGSEQECMQRDANDKSVYNSIARLEEEGLVEKRDAQPDTRRTRMDARVTEDGWRVLTGTGLIGAVRSLAPLF